MSLPTAANPLITGGGLCGESKISILDQVSEAGAALAGAVHEPGHRPDLAG